VIPWVALLSIFLYTSLHIALPKSEGDISIFVTEKADDLKYLISSTLKSAHQSIELATFGLSDPDLVPLLRNLSLRGIKVHLLFDPKQPQYLSKAPDVTFEPYLGRGLMHRKIVGIDDELLLLGSTNLTLFSLAIHRNMVIAIRSKNLCNSLKTNQILKENALTFFPIPHHGKTALSYFLNEIDKAQKRISGAIFTFTHPKITDHLIAAHNRGVKVTIYFDRGMAKGICRKNVNRLRESGIEVKTHVREGLLHHKCALIDDHLLFGSANWTKAAFEKNQEYIIFIDPLSKKQLKTIESFFSVLEKSTI